VYHNGTTPRKYLMQPLRIRNATKSNQKSNQF